MRKKAEEILREYVDISWSPDDLGTIFGDMAKHRLGIPNDANPIVKLKWVLVRSW